MGVCELDSFCATSGVRSGAGTLSGNRLRDSNSSLIIGFLQAIGDENTMSFNGIRQENMLVSLFNIVTDGGVQARVVREQQYFGTALDLIYRASLLELLNVVLDAFVRVVQVLLVEPVRTARH